MDHFGDYVSQTQFLSYSLRATDRISNKMSVVILHWSETVQPVLVSTELSWQACTLTKLLLSRMPWSLHQYRRSLFGDVGM